MSFWDLCELDYVCGRMQSAHATQALFRMPGLSADSNGEATQDPYI